MPQYPLSVYQPDVGMPGADAIARIKADLHRLNEELRESGPAVARVVRIDPPRSGEAVVMATV